MESVATAFGKECPMRIERPRAAGEDLRTGSRQSKARPLSSGTRSASAIDARLLQMLRRKVGPGNHSSALGTEILRLAGLAAAVHRGTAMSVGDGAAVACSHGDSIATAGGDTLETPR